MDFALCTKPDRIAESMCKPMAWEMLRLGHAVHAVEATKSEEGWKIRGESSDPLPKDPFVYGYTGLVEACAHGGAPEGWRVDWNPQRFDRERWIEELGDIMWNHGAAIMTLREALDRLKRKEGRYHLCPSGADSGTKAFKGFLSNGEDLDFQMSRAALGKTLDLDMRVALTPEDQPDEEYRVVMIGGEVIAAGRYLVKGVLSEEKGCPKEVEDFARSSGKIWRPGEFHVTDVGLKRRRMGVIEFNSLHSSGLYRIDRERVVAGINDGWKDLAPKGRMRDDERITRRYKHG